MLRILAATALLATSQIAFAQSVAPGQTVAATASQPIPGPKPGSFLMPAGTMLVVTPAQEISSKHVEEGQRVLFRVVHDVVEADRVVIRRGSPVYATVAWKTGRAIGGKSGKFQLRFDSVRVNGRDHAVTGQFRQEGRGNTVGALLGSMWITGRSAVMMPGELVNVFTDEPVIYW
jgi:hypothetical protein